MDLITYALCKKYVDSSLSGLGSLKGEDGQSAYELAVANGFSGSETEWLDSLKGEAPSVGENGNWFIGNVDTGISAKVITNYEDLENLPDIPTKTSELDNDSNFITLGDLTVSTDENNILELDENGVFRVISPTPVPKEQIESLFKEE